MTDGTIIKAYIIDDLYFVFVDDINCGVYNSEQLLSLINSRTPCIVKYYSSKLFSVREFEK